MIYEVPVYEPAASVKMANSIPRFDYSTFSPIEANEFPTNLGDLAAMPPTDPYVKGAATLPIMLMVVGFASIVILQLILFLRFCCRCFSCGPYEEDIVTNPVKVIKSRNRIFYGFWFFILLMLVADHMLYFGNGDLTKGKDNLILSLNLLKGVFTDIAAATNLLISENTDLTTITFNIAQGACNGGTSYASGSSQETATESMYDAATGMLTAFTAIDDLVKNLPDMIQGFIDSAELFGEEYKNMGMYALYGLILVLTLIFVIGSCLTSKFIMYLGVLIGEVVCIISTIICGIVMIVVTVYGDFCMNPGQNMMNAVGPGSAADMLEYFSTCVGTDPFEGNINTANSQLTDFNTAITDNFSSSCTAVTEASTAVSGMQSGITGVGTAAACSALNPVYDTFMNQAMCTNMFDGLWTIWLCACIASFSLFFVMSFGSVLWAYFGVAWKLQPEDQHTGTHGHLTGTNMEATSVANYEAPNGYQEEYTFTAASPSAPALTRREIEMI